MIRIAACLIRDVPIVDRRKMTIVDVEKGGHVKSAAAMDIRRTNVFTHVKLVEMFTKVENALWKSFIT